MCRVAFRFSGTMLFFLVYYRWMRRSYTVSRTGVVGDALNTSAIFPCVSSGGYAKRLYEESGMYG